MTIETILIVEDDADDCEMITEGLLNDSPDLKLKCFTNPVDALKYLHTSEDMPSLIISDINMPLMNGVEFKKELDRDATLKKIPFFFLTTSSNAIASQLNVTDYFVKPSSVIGFREIVRSIIKIVKKEVIKTD